MSSEEYDSLTAEERDLRDKADREREAAEQAGNYIHLSTFWPCYIFKALPYHWTQELGEVDIVVPVPKGTRAKDVAVVLQRKKLSVGLKGQEKILEGEFCKDIKVEDSTWTIREFLNV
jgi:hypothetical protein